MSGRFRSWSFTLNNFTDIEYNKLQNVYKEKQIKYIVFGREIGEEGTPHLQGYVYFHNAKTFNQVKAYLGDRFHIEQSKGSPQENIAYCTKDDEYIEFGDPPSQGTRKDIQDVKEMIKSGSNMRQITESATSYQSIRMAEILMKYRTIKHREKPQVRWYYGETGSGKTMTAFSELGYDDTWVNSNNLQWFDGYDGQKNVIIDDFRGNQCTFAFLLRLLDRYPLQVPIKGGFSNWSPENIYITSTSHPKDVYQNENIQENIEQLIRRIDIILQFMKK